MTAPTKADAAAADRLLKAAVLRAQQHIATPTTPDGPRMAERVSDAVAMFTAACTAADLLLEVRDA